MQKLDFYDLKKKKKFTTTKYKLVKKSGKKFAVTKSPSGIEVWRIVSKDFKG